MPLGLLKSLSDTSKTVETYTVHQKADGMFVFGESLGERLLRRTELLGEVWKIIRVSLCKNFFKKNKREKQCGLVDKALTEESGDLDSAPGSATERLCHPRWVISPLRIYISLLPLSMALKLFGAITVYYHVFVQCLAGWDADLRVCVYGGGCL